eukprot:m.597407 g.597407  ORF g.597407 m.597407 type:complete len:72 (+) comp58068_c0_seq1:2638-2853(+)
MKERFLILIKDIKLPSPSWSPQESMKPIRFQKFSSRDCTLFLSYMRLLRDCRDRFVPYQAASGIELVCPDY